MANTKMSAYWQQYRPVLEELVQAGLSDRQIAESGQIPGANVSKIKNARHRFGLRGGDHYRGQHREIPTLTRVVSETPERVVLAPEESDEEPIEELLERTFKRTEREIKRATTRRYALARIVTDRPIALTFISDQHLSTSGAVDVRRAMEDAETVQQTPGLYAILGGDGVDNHIKHRAALVAKASTPTDEWRLYDYYLRTLGHKALAVISGNHDDWTRDFSGVDMVARLASAQKIHYAPDELVMTVQIVGKDGTERQAYTAKIRHQYRYNSSLNLGHTVKRMYDMGSDPFDIGVVCHNHAAHIETFDRHGLTRYALRPGSYQIQTAHGRRYGYADGYPTCPGVVLWPDERRIEPFEDLRGLVEKLRDVRQVEKRAA